MSHSIGVTLNNVITDLWIKDRFEEQSSSLLKTLRSLHPEIFGELDCRYPHLFLFSLNSLDYLSSQKIWIARDGFLLLKLFFEKFPDSPVDATFKIYIEADLVSLVPHGWKGIIYSYQVHSTQIPDHQKLKVLFNPNLPTTKSLSATLGERKFESVGVTLSNKGLGFNFAQSEKALISFFSDLSKRSSQLESFPLDYYAQYPNIDDGAPFLNMNDGFLCALSQSFMLYLNCNFRVLSPMKSGVHTEELKINLHSSFFLSSIPVEARATKLQGDLLLQLANSSSDDAAVPFFPFTQNYAKAGYEFWKSK